VSSMSVEGSANNSMVSDEDKQRYRALFVKLDADKNGTVEVGELAAALRLQKVSDKQAAGHAKEIISRGDKDDDAKMDFDEFVVYMHGHETKLKTAFLDLDKNKDGHIEPCEVQAALSHLGVSIDLSEAEKLTKQLDKDGSMTINWEEWRNAMQLSSKDDLEDILISWRQSGMIDIGDNLTCPPEFTKKEKQTGMWWRHLVAGGSAGAVSRSFTAPLDRVKIYMQVHASKESTLSVFGVLKNMVTEGGVKSLWRGNATNVLKIAPESAIKFAAYEQVKKLIVGERVKDISVIERFAAGASAGAIAQTCIYPLEVIKTRLAVSKTGQYKGILDCGARVLKENGPKGLFKGYIPNLIGIIPYAGIDLSIYETMKQMYMKAHPEEKQPSIMLLLACGTFSSTCGQLASYPLALVRTRLQAGGKGNFLSMTKNILAEEGLRGLYRGILPNFMKVLPAVSVSYVIYEHIKGKLC